MQVEYEHEIGEKVLIDSIGMSGRVDALMTDSQGPQYHVVFWNDGVRQSSWMYEWEIKKL